MVLVAATARCGSSSAPPPPTRNFPAGFLWGVASSAQESEGNNTNSDWDVFAAIGKAPPAGWAENSYQLYDTDNADTAALRMNMTQFTIEWARIVPKMPADPTAPLGPGDIDAKEVAHYHQVIASAKAHGLLPVVTVTHFSLPKWVDDPAAYDASSNTYTDGSLGGWTNPKTGQALARYASFLATEFGKDVQWWLTMDEPMVDLVAGYMGGVFPPGTTAIALDQKSLPNGATPIDVVRNMIAGHALAYHAIKQVQPSAHVSFAQNSIDWDPMDPSSADDVAAAARVDHAYNLQFLDAVTTGAWDTSLVGNGPNEQHPEWAHTLDFLGVNYYEHDVARADPGLLPPLDAVPCAGALKDAFPKLWAQYGCPDKGPDQVPGMTAILKEYDQRYHLPELVTENGFIDTPDGKARRLVRTLGAVADAIDAGAQVIGYTYWTLNYDYEWNDGWTQNMGIYTIAGFGDGSSFPGGAPGPTTDFTRVPLHPMIDVVTTIAGSDSLPSNVIAQYGSP